MVCSRSPFLTSSCSQVRAVPGLRQEEQPLWIPAWFLRGIITPLCHPSHGPGVEMIWGMCESIPVSSWQSQPSQCCSCQQSGEPPASPLGCPALAPPHSSPCSKVRAFTIPQSMASSVTHLLFFFAGDIKYDEAMGYPMVQHWRVRSNLYKVKLSSITLSAGEGFQGQGDVCLHGWGVLFCPKHPTDIFHAVFPAVPAEAGREICFLFDRGETEAGSLCSKR